MTESRRRQRGSGLPGPKLPGTPVLGNGSDAAPSGSGIEDESWTCMQCGWAFSGSSADGMPAEVQQHMDSHLISVPAAEAEADAGTEAIWDAYDQTLAAAVRERDRALDKATARLASVTAGGYLEYDRSVSVALAAFESAWHNARTAHAAVPR